MFSSPVSESATSSTLVTSSSLSRRLSISNMRCSRALLVVLELALVCDCSYGQSLWELILGQPLSRTSTISTTTTTTSTTTTTKAPTTSRGSRVIIDPSYLLGCLEPGTFPVVGDCSRFVVCHTGALGLRGQRYKCPSDFFYNGRSRALSQPRVLDFLSNVYSNRFRSLLQSPNRCLPRDEVECPWSSPESQPSSLTSSQSQELSTKGPDLGGELPQERSSTTEGISRTTSTTTATTTKPKETTTIQPASTTTTMSMKSSTNNYFSFLSLL
ncbi:hypothetical protein TCAL_11369, partial [Tigriopus californicus]